MRYFSYNMMYYKISKNEKILFFGKKNRPGVGSDLKLMGPHVVCIKNDIYQHRYYWQFPV